MSHYTANVKLYWNGTAVNATQGVLAFGVGDTVPDATVTRDSLFTGGFVTSQPDGGTPTPFTPISREIANATYLTAGAAVNLTTLGLGASTTDVRAVMDAAVTAGYKRIIVPYTSDMPVAGWPMLTLFTATGVAIDFQPGAKLNLTMTTLAFDLTSSRLTGAYLTSPYTGPTSAADNFDSSGSLTYVYDARGVRLRDDCVVENHYQENCATGIEFYGARTRGRNLRFKNIRQYMGWGSAVHAGSSPGVGSLMHHCYLQNIHIEDSDRGCEIEAGSTYNTFRSGYQKNVGPSGYTGQPGAYSDYTFVLDCHSHVGEGGCRGNVFRDWHLLDCYGAITAVRSDGSNDSDYPVGNVWDNITIEGRASATGYESVYLQGHSNKATNIRLRAGAGITAKHRVLFTSGTGNEVDISAASGYALPLVSVGSDNSTLEAQVRARRITAAPSAGSGFLFDVFGVRTALDLIVQGATAGAGVTGTTGYLQLNSTATGSRTSRFDYAVASGETFAAVIAEAGANDVDLSGINGLNNETAVPDLVTSGGVTRGRAVGVISRSAVAVSVNLGGASSLFDTSKLDTTLGTITDAGVNSRIARQGANGFISTIDDPALAAFISAQSTTTPITWPTANLGVGVRKRVGRRSFLTRFRFKVVTTGGNYYAAVTDTAGKVLWKTTTALPAAGVQSLTMTGVEVQPGQEVVMFLALSSTTAAVAGLSITAADQTLFGNVNGAPHAVSVANLYTTNTAVGSTITLGSTLAAFQPLVTLFEV